MKTRLAAACAILPAIVGVMGTPASAHRLDEYLQATTFSLDQDRVQAKVRLTPGVAVFPAIFADMDTNGDGVFSPTEQRAYAERAMGDMSLTLDGNPLRLQLVGWKFAAAAEMKAGRGDSQIEFAADAPRNVGRRKLIFENHHQPRNAVYLVNCLVPRDPNIQVTAQKRNYLQSRYELDYAQSGVPSSQPSFVGRSDIPAGRPGIPAETGAVLLLLSAPFAWLLLHRARAERTASL